YVPGLDVENADQRSVGATHGRAERNERAVRRGLREHQHLITRPSVGVEHRLWFGAGAPQDEAQLLITLIAFPAELTTRTGRHRHRPARVRSGLLQLRP